MNIVCIFVLACIISSVAGFKQDTCNDDYRICQKDWWARFIGYCDTTFEDCTRKAWGCTIAFICNPLDSKKFLGSESDEAALREYIKHFKAEVLNEQKHSV